ncbi:DUF1380 domain-containing protein [Pantoea agglomerans]|nr:DUF1380 domain-containing protein [Pantoea agglomerans]
MYGTVSQLCNDLKIQFEGDKKITLIIWRKEDVIRVMGGGARNGGNRRRNRL